MAAALVAVSILVAFGAGVLLTWWLRRFTLAAGMLDHPNPRSLHTEAVPRGGGLAIVLVVAVALLTAWGTTDRSGISTTLPVMLAMLVLLAASGWLDDRRGLSPLLRLAVHTLAAGLLVYGVGAFGELALAGLHIPLGPIAGIFSVLWIVWLANGFNFMDGIDGIAASQAAVAACTMGLWFALRGDTVMALVCYVIMAASLGFLVWNWAPARIFMGDVGSVSLGGTFAALALVGNQLYEMPLGAFVLLLGVFIADTTVTLIRRLGRSEAVWRAHREHYYQRAVAAGWGHARVTLLVILLAVVMALLATLELHSPNPWWWLVALAVLGGSGAAVVIRERRTDTQ